MRVLVAALVMLATPAAAEGPRFAWGGEAFGSLAPVDRGYFNATDYDTNALRTVRLALQGELRLAPRLAALADVRAEDFERAYVHAAYLRLSIPAGVPVDVQAGRIPPVFGAFPRRRYAADTPVPGYPLAYQYLVALRTDSLPSRAADLARSRGRGWRLAYPVGSADPDTGIPLVSGQRWDIGAQLRAGTDRLHAAVSVTRGAPSEPRVEDDNGGAQATGRVGWAPTAGIALGASIAAGDWVSDQAWPGEGRRRQTAWGLDAEWSGGPWLARVEAVGSRWQVPTIAHTLTATAVMAEGRWRAAPGVSLGVRLDRLSFGDLAGIGSWETGVSRMAAGASWSVRRQVVLKGGLQLDVRDTRAGPRRRQLFPVAQALVWF